MEATLPVRRKPTLPPLHLDPAIPNQALRVRSALRAAIIDGLMAPGFRLPSSRELSVRLGIGRNMIVAAYEHLASDGLIETRHGSGTYVTAGLPPAPTIARAPQIGLSFGRKLPFTLGQTHVDPDFMARLASATRRHIARADPSDLAYGDPRGTLRLRRQIAEFLAVTRGIRCDPDCVMVTNGTQHGLRICADALLSVGDQVWFEDPGYGLSRATLAASGAQPIAVPVDARGLDVAAGLLAAPGARGVYVTPSHQFPTGTHMGMERRAALIDWAEGAGAWIFEDDYDSEFSYSGPPLTALAGLSPGRVIYLGTFAKTLFPGLRLGWAVIPPETLGKVIQARAAIDRFTPSFMQDAVADLMADGTVATHLRRNLRRYRAHRDLVAGIIAAQAQGVLTAEVPEHGLHMIAQLRADLPAGLAGDIRHASGVSAVLLSEARMQPGGPEGFVLGFSGYEAAELEAAATSLAQAAARLGAGAQPQG